MKAIYLKPRGSFKTTLRSDTLWGLLLVAIREMFSRKEVDGLIEKFKSGNPPFLISSAMLYTEEKEIRYHWFPRPLSKSANFKADTLEERERLKKIRKISLIEKRVFEEHIKGEPTGADLNSVSALTTEYVLHTSIDRMSCSTLEIDGEGQLYYNPETYIKDGGLFFLIEGSLDYVEPALRFLQINGFGGDTSVGKGFYDFDIDDFTLSIPDNPTHFVSLSLYTPDEDEVKSFSELREDIWYEIEVRSGKLGSHHVNFGDYKKKSVVAFKEGSVFPILNKRNYGKIRPVKTLPTHEAYFYGYSFVVPIRRKETA